MKISLVQFCPLWNCLEKNYQRIFDIIKNDDSDILVFPELAATGYLFSNRKETLNLAEPFLEGYNLQVQEFASEQNKIIVSGFIEKSKEKIYNSAGIYLPNKSLSRVYRKTHLFYKEKFCFDAGDTGFFVVDSSTIRIGTMICYDWRFPEAARSLGLKGADLIVCPSNLVTNVWQKIMPARALENKVYLAVANRVGTESDEYDKLLFNGDSAIYSYNSEILAKADSIEETIITAEIFPEETRNKMFNDYNDIFSDRVPNLYDL